MSVALREVERYSVEFGTTTENTSLVPTKPWAHSKLQNSTFIFLEDTLLFSNISIRLHSLKTIVIMYSLFSIMVIVVNNVETSILKLVKEWYIHLLDKVVSICRLQHMGCTLAFGIGSYLRFHLVGTWHVFSSYSPDIHFQ